MFLKALIENKLIDEKGKYYDKKNEILFLFNQNKNDRIELIPEYPVSKLDFSDESIILLIEDSKELTLCEDTARESLYALQNLLLIAIDKKLQLHPSIKDNIGFLYNEDLKNYLSHKFRDKSLWTKQMMSDGYFFEKNDLLTYELFDNVYALGWGKISAMGIRSCFMDL